MNVDTELLQGKMSVDELCEILGLQSGLIDESDIRKGSLDNYDGNEGVNVEFEITIDDSTEHRHVHEYQIKVTDWFSL